MIDNARDVKIGELLSHAGLLSPGDVIEAIQVSKRLTIPVGRVLLTSGCLSDSILQASLQAQYLIKEGYISLDDAAKALRLVADGMRNLQQALESIECHTDFKNESVHLADLLLDSNIVSQDQLDQAMETSYQTDIPLAGALVIDGVLSANFFPSVLRAQERIKNGEVSREEAINELKSNFLLWVKAEESMQEREAEEKRKSQQKKQKKSNNKQESQRHEQASQVHKAPTAPAAPEQVQTQVVSFPEVPPDSLLGNNWQEIIQDNQRSALTNDYRLVDLLRRSGVIQEGDLRSSVERLFNNPDLSAKFFSDMDVLDAGTTEAARRCHSLIHKGLLTEEQAVRVIRETATGAVQFDDALRNETIDKHPYFDQGWRKKTLTRALAAGAIGTVLGAIFLGRRK